MFYYSERKFLLSHLFAWNIVMRVHQRELDSWIPYSCIASHRFSQRYAHLSLQPCRIAGWTRAIYTSSSSYDSLSRMWTPCVTDFEVFVESLEGALPGTKGGRFGGASEQSSVATPEGQASTSKDLFLSGSPSARNAHMYMGTRGYDVHCAFRFNFFHRLLLSSQKYA